MGEMACGPCRSCAASSRSCEAAEGSCCGSTCDHHTAACWAKWPYDTPVGELPHVPPLVMALAFVSIALCGPFGLAVLLGGVK